MCRLLIASILLAIIAPTVSQTAFAQSVSAPKPAAITFLEKRKIETQEAIREVEKKKTLFEIEMNALQKRADAVLESQAKMNVSKESYPEVLKALHLQRVQLMIDLAGLDARQKVLTSRLKKVDSTKSQRMRDTLEKIVTLKTRQLEQIRKMSEIGDASLQELRKAELALLESKLKLTQIKNESSERAGLNDQFVELALSQAETRARLEKTTSLIGEIEPLRKDIAKFDTFIDEKKQLIIDRNRYRTRLLELSDRLAKIENDIIKTTEELRNQKPDNQSDEQ